MADGLWRKVKLLLDPASAKRLKEETKDALDKGTDPKTPTKNLSAIERGMGGLRKTAVALTAVFAGLFAIGRIKRFAEESTKAAIEIQRGQRNLAQQLKNMGIAYADVRREIEAHGRALWETHRLTQGEVDQLLPALLLATNDYATALRSVGLAQDLAAATGMDHRRSALLLGRVLQGDVAALKRYGIHIHEGADAVKALEAQIGGMARASLPWTEVLAKAWGDFREEVGLALIEAGKAESVTDRLTNAIRRMTEFVAENRDTFVDWSHKVIDAFRGVAEIVGTVFSALVTKDRDTIEEAFRILGSMAASAFSVGFFDTFRAVMRTISDAITPAAMQDRGMVWALDVFNSLSRIAEDAAEAAFDSLDAQVQAMAALQARLARERELERIIRERADAERSGIGGGSSEGGAPLDTGNARIAELIRARDLGIATREENLELLRIYAEMTRQLEAGNVATAERNRLTEQTRKIEEDMGLKPRIGIAGAQVGQQTPGFQGISDPIIDMEAARKAAVDQFAEDWLEHNALLVDTAHTAAWGVQNAWEGAFAALIAGGEGVDAFMGNLFKGIAAGGLGALAQYASGQVAMNVAEAVSQHARALGWTFLNPGQAAASHASAAKHWGAAALWGALSGGSSAAGGALSGSVGAGGLHGGATDPTGRMADEFKPEGPEIHIYVDGFNPYDSKHQEMVGRAVSDWDQRTGKVRYHPRKYGH